MTAPVANPHAHLPSIPEVAQYRMSATLEGESGDLWINTTLPDGTRIVCAEPEGWEGLTFITPIDQAGGRDGGLVGPPSVAPRVLAIQGAMVAPDARTLRLRIRDLRNRLTNRRTVVWSQYDLGAGERLALVCYAQGDLRSTPVMGNQRGGVATRFYFELVAANPPWKYSFGQPSQACVGLPESDVSGWTYTRTYPWTYGAVLNPGGSIYPDNRGDIPAWPVFEVTGPVSFPIITNERTGRSFLVSADVPAGQTVSIDSRTGVIQPQQYRLVGRPFPLEPGVNTVRWRASNGVYDPGAELCLNWRNTWE